MGRAAPPAPGAGQAPIRSFYVRVERAFSPLATLSRTLRAFDASEMGALRERLQRIVENRVVRWNARSAFCPERISNVAGNALRGPDALHVCLRVALHFSVAATPESAARSRA